MSNSNKIKTMKTLNNNKTKIKQGEKKIYVFFGEESFPMTLKELRQQYIDNSDTPEDVDFFFDKEEIENLEVGEYYMVDMDCSIKRVN